MRRCNCFRLLVLFSLILLMLSACDQIGIDFSDSPTNGGAAIFISAPPDGTHVSVGQIVDIGSEVTSPSGAFAVHLIVNGQTYYFDQMYQDIKGFKILQPWTPAAPGVYLIQTKLEEKTGGQSESNTITIYVDVVEDIETEEEQIEEPLEEAEEECPRPIATTHSFANCRSGPGTAYDITEGLRPDESFYIIGKSYSETWWQIERIGGGKTCWIWENLIDICGNTDDVEVVNVQEKDEVIEEEAQVGPTDPLPAAYSACHDYPDFGICTSDPEGFGGCSWDTGQSQCVP